MNSTKVSIVIPVYNVECYLRKCLDSVINQTYQNLEIIIVNDGSMDQSLEICREYEKKDSRVVFIDKENEGSGKTRNRGIAVATGEYIAFLDSDDWWDLRYVEKMVNAMEGYQADLVVCDFVFVEEDENGSLQNHISEIRLPDSEVIYTKDDPDVINKCRTYLCGKLFKTSYFTKYEIEQPNMPINDFPIVPVLVALSEKIVRVAMPMYFYLRGREGNTVTSFKTIESFVDSLESLRDNWKRYIADDKFMDALHKMYYSQVRFALKKGMIAVEKGAKSEILEELKKKMVTFLHTEWKESDIIWKDHTFSYIGNSDIEEGIRRFLIDESNYVGPNCNTASVVLVDQNNRLTKTDNEVAIEIKQGLEGEVLFWDIADQILFTLTKRGE